MNKKSITLIAGTAVLICLAGVYFLLGRYNEKTEEAAADAASGETVLEIDTEALASAAFSIDGTEQTFVKDGDSWTLEGDETFPVDSSALLSCLSGLTPLKAQRTLTDISDISEYGLDDPQNTVTLTDSDGVQTTITFGDSNANTSDNYVMLDENTSTIYTVESSFLGSLSQDLYSYALSDELPQLQTDEITGVRVSGTDNDYELADVDGAWMVADAQGVTENADEDQVTALLSYLTSLYYSDYLEHNCSDLSPYGLDDPAALITISWEDENSMPEAEEETPASETEESSEAAAGAVSSVAFAIGTTDDSGNYYVQMEGSTQVHTLSSTLVEAVLDASADSLQETEAETGTELSEAESETQQQ